MIVKLMKAKGQIKKIESTTSYFEKIQAINF